MSKFRQRLEALRRELSAGQGGKLWQRPVPLEPSYVPFHHFRPRDTRLPCLFEGPPLAASEELAFLRLRPSEEDRYSSELSEQLLVSLNPGRPIAFEVAGFDGKVVMQVAAASSESGVLRSQFEGHYPQCEVFESEDALLKVKPRLRKTRGYRLRRSHLFPVREAHKAETYAALVGALASLQPGDAALFQALFVPVRSDWQGNILAVARDLFDPAKSAFSDTPHLPKKAEAKVAKPLFAVSVRLAASGNELLDMLEGSFLAQFQSEENSVVPIPESYPVEGILKRVSYSTGMLLNAGELAALVHVPNPEDVPEALEAAEPGAPPPRLATHDVLVPLGWNRYRGVDTPVGLSAEQLTRHLALFGGSGNGKTNLMLVAFEPLIGQGYGMAAIDFKGDFAQGLLDRVPEHRVNDVVLFDPTDREFPPTLNVLEASAELSHEALTAELMVGLKRLFHDSSEFGPRMEWILRNAVRALLAAEGAKTLYDIPRFLENASFRDSTLSTVDDRELREFWQRRTLSQSVIDPVLNRLSSFLDRTTIRNIVSQPNRIDFRQVMRERRIFIANLEKGVLQDAAFVLGSFILSRLQLAALARRPEERVLFPIVCDEFHHVAGQGMDTESIETFLSEARSYMAPLAISTQYVGRLSREVIAALFGNVGTLVCMHLGQIDAQIMQRERRQRGCAYVQRRCPPRRRDSHRVAAGEGVSQHQQVSRGRV